ncbi:MAG: hypothetical protein PVI75_03005 [Gammaproteobacteria bacterium]|jgi:hypothetical protein
MKDKIFTGNDTLLAKINNGTISLARKGKKIENPVITWTFKQLFQFLKLAFQEEKDQHDFFIQNGFRYEKNTYVKNCAPENLHKHLAMMSNKIMQLAQKNEPTKIFEIYHTHLNEMFNKIIQGKVKLQDPQHDFIQHILSCTKKVKLYPKEKMEEVEKNYNKPHPLLSVFKKIKELCDMANKISAPKKKKTKQKIITPTFFPKKEKEDNDKEQSLKIKKQPNPNNI